MVFRAWHLIIIEKLEIGVAFRGQILVPITKQAKHKKTGPLTSRQDQKMLFLFIRQILETYWNLLLERSLASA